MAVYMRVCHWFEATEKGGSRVADETQKACFHVTVAAVHWYIRSAFLVTKNSLTALKVLHCVGTDRAFTCDAAF